MIVRICRDIVLDDQLETYLNELLKTVMPEYSGANGLLSVSIVQRRFVVYGEIATISVWQSLASMNTFCQNRLPRPTSPYYGVSHHNPIVYELVSRMAMADGMSDLYV